MKSTHCWLLAHSFLLIVALLPASLSSLKAQDNLIEPNVLIPVGDYDPCAEPSNFTYSNALEGPRLCDEFPNYTPSPGCTIAGGTTTQYGANTLISNQNYLVNGIWTIIVGTLQDIETNFVFDHCNFKMAPGAQIIIKCNNNKDMAFENCNLFSCDQMWRGISVEHTYTILGLNPPSFRFEFCHIEDAASALYFRNPSLAVSFQITENTFNNNYVGVTAFKDFVNVAPQWMSLGLRGNDFGTNQNLRPFYSIKVPPFWPLAYAGVSIKKLTTFVGALGSTNSFFRMTNGLVTESAVVTSVHNSYNTLWVNGIMSVAGSLTVNNQNMFEGSTANLPTGQAPPIMENGIFAIGSDLNIVSNTFIHRLRHGIWSEQNQHAQKIVVESNTFTGSSNQQWGLSTPSGIRIERSAAAPSASIPAHNDIKANIFDVSCKVYVAILVEGANTATDQLLIRDRNDISLSNSAPSGMVGIAVRTGNGEHTEILGNLVDLNGKFQQGNYGIELSTYNSVTSKIRDNDVAGGLDPFPDPQVSHPYAAQCCIHNHNSDDAITDICNNNVTGSQRGLHFIEGMAEVRENKIHDHEFGVDIQPYPILPMLGQQDGRGNQWLGSYITNAAVRRGTGGQPGQFPQLCRFWAFEDVQPSIYLPASNLLDPNPDLEPNPSLKWFKFDPLLPADYCSEMAQVPGVNGFEMKVAANMFTDLPVAKIWDVKRNLYRKLLENGDLMQNNTTLQNFYASHQNTLLASFAQTDAFIRSATRYTASAQQNRDAITQSIQQNLTQANEQLATMDYNLAVATPTQRANLSDWGTQISNSTYDRDVMDQARQQQIESLLNLAQASNDALVPTNTQQQLRKDLNTLLIKSLRSAPTNAQDYQAALTIASTGSEIAGAAAHDAMFLLKNCDQKAFLTQHEDVTVQKRGDLPVEGISQNSQALTISPNPSNGLFQVTLHNPAKGRLRVISTTGEVVRSIVLDGQASILVDLSYHARGVYFLALHDANGQLLETTRILVH